MKRGTPRHPKTYELAQALAIPLPHAVGLLEMLWHHTAQYTPQGDIGRLPDAAIAEAVNWTGSVATLIDTLVEKQWLDCDSKHRLLVHDWADHCDQAVRKWLDRNKKTIYVVTGQRRDRVRSTTVIHPLSREAKAKAKAKACVESVVLEKPEGTEGESVRGGIERSRIEGQALFERMIGAFLAAGALLSEPDRISAATEWVSLDESHWERAVAFAEAKARTTEARFMGLPANYLRKREWTRAGPGRILPNARSPSKREVGLEEAVRRLKHERGES